MKHYVYYIAGWSGLLYIGRSLDPERRLRSFRQRTGVHQSWIARTRSFDSLESACKAELVAIRYHKPPHNKHLVSNAGFLGSKHSAKAKARTPEFCAHMSEVQKGKSIPTEQRAKLSAALKGRPKSEATKARMKAAWILRKEQQSDRA